MGLCGNLGCNPKVNTKLGCNTMWNAEDCGQPKAHA